MVCSHFRKFGWKGGGCPPFGCMIVFCRDGIHCWQRRVSCCWHDIILWHQGGLPRSLITKRCHPWWLWLHGPVMCQWFSGPPTWSGLRLWISKGKSHRLSARTVWTYHPIILPCQCHYTGSWHCTWAGSSGVGHLGGFWEIFVGT